MIPAVSGIYFAKLVSSSGSSHVVFIVRNDASTSDLYFQTSDTTWQAYNDYGGNSLYVGNPVGPGLQGQLQPPVQRPASTSEHDFFFNAEYPMSASWRPTATTSATRPASTPTGTAAC